MNEQFVVKCNELFEGKNVKQDIEDELKQLKEYFYYEISTEYRYILERYAGVYIREDYGFKALEKTPLTNKRGFNFIISFFHLKGRKNIFETYEVYKRQLPVELIPIGEMDGGNLLCLNRMTQEVYIWIHDEVGRNTHLVQKSICDFIYSFEKVESEKSMDLGIVETKFSAGFLEALRNYKK